MRAEIITVGDELLIGQVVDSNSAWLGQMLNKYGIKIHRINSISDNAEEIKTQLTECLQRSEIIIMTGGLGPTKDDITKKTLVEYFKMGWRLDEAVMAQLVAFYKNRGREMLEVNKLQADLPDGCKTLFNFWGTAPGMWFDIGEKVLISMPGVPYEMKNIFEFNTLPLIAEKFKQPKLFHKTIVTINIAESILAKRIEHIEDALPSYIKLAYLPNWNMVRLRLTGTEQIGEDIVAKIDSITNEIHQILGDSIVAFKDLSMAEIAFELLSEKNKTLSVAESCTGGYISHQMTQISGASKVFVGSVVSYSNSVKHHQLGVESTLFETVGAVSEQVVIQMVEGVRERLDTDYAIAVSGIAGPNGGSEDKPVGTVVIGVCSNDKTVVRTWHFIGDRMNVIGRSNNMAFDMLRKLILEN
ncbi:MAG: competence/damage-inducible protein A [Bacteroidetes bacterium]|nr:competence/damage-inducible protein A [Bacteroidota bacterium]